MNFIEQLVKISYKINMYVHHMWKMLQKIVYTSNLAYLK